MSPNLLVADEGEILYTFIRSKLYAAKANTKNAARTKTIQ